MLKVIIFTLCLLSLSYEETLAPWHQRKFEYSVSDLCSYNDDIFQYVKPCGQNYICNDIEVTGHQLSVCQQYFTTTKRLEDTCTSDLEYVILASNVFQVLVLSRKMVLLI